MIRTLSFLSADSSLAVILLCEMDFSSIQMEQRLEKFKSIITKYDINYDFAFRLRALEGFEIVMIIDDSSSMCTPVIDLQRRDISPFERLPTRWDELKQTVSVIVDLAAAVAPEGIDIYFLNRPPLLHVKDSLQLNEIFSKLPNGPTPLTRVLSEVLTLKKSSTHDRKLLMLIATDGVPTDEKGMSDLPRLQNILQRDRHPFEDRIYITFIACTNDMEAVGYLNGLDKRARNVDVIDDYQSERAEVLAVQGKNFPFSYGDYVVKILMGAVDKWFDELDEKKVRLNNTNAQQRQPSKLSRNGRKQSCKIS